MTTISHIIHLGLIRVLLSLYLFYDCLDLKYFILTYRKIAIGCILFFFFQEFSYYTAGIRIPGVAWFLPNALVEDTASFLASMAEDERSSSFFSEPAHFVQFLLPLLIVELFAYVHVNWRRVIILVITLLFLQSGNAMVGLVIIGISYFYFLYFSKKISIVKKFIALTFVSLLSFVVIIGYVGSEKGSKLMDRSETLKSSSVDGLQYANSGFIRIWRGYFVFQEYDLLYKIIGNSNSGYLASKINQSSVSVFFVGEERYMNTIQYFLVTTGYVGLLLFFCFIISELKKTNVCGKVLLLLLVGLSFISYLFFTSTMLVCIILAHLMPRNTILDNKNLKQYNFC